MVEVKLVRTPDEASAVYVLAYEFIDWLRGRYPEMSADIDTYLHHQEFDQQIRDVLTYYNPPSGECLLAVQEASPIGILMLKDLGDGVCEMNRMFVREGARGSGAGRALLKRLRDRAVEMGFTNMTLSALSRHHEAIALYRSMGFVGDDRPSEAGNSGNAVLMKLDLTQFRE